MRDKKIKIEGLKKSLTHWVEWGKVRPKDRLGRDINLNIDIQWCILGWMYNLVSVCLFESE